MKFLILLLTLMSQYLFATSTLPLPQLPSLTYFKELGQIGTQPLVGISPSNLAKLIRERLVAETTIDDVGRAHLHKLKLLSWFEAATSPIDKLVFEGRLRHFHPDLKPVFIVGHWRSGTTLLHNYLSLNESFIAPNTFQVLFPEQFLLLEPFARKVLDKLIKLERKIDKMELSFSSPQEDEFAMLNMGQKTIYQDLINPETADGRYVSFSDYETEELRRFEKAMVRFLKRVKFRNPEKRLLLKSPPHTARMKQLAEWFPEAVFIHISRNPLEIYPSTMNMWKKLTSMSGVNMNFDEDRLSSVVINNLKLMYDKHHYAEARDILGHERLFEISYEELTRDPEQSLRQMYADLDLGNFEEVVDKVREQAQKLAGYQRNSFKPLDRQTVKQLSKQWSDYASLFGYGK